MKEDKYAKLCDVEYLIELIDKRDIYYDWSKEFEELDEQVKYMIEKIRRTAKVIK